jgi:hypothetical protein
MPNLDAMTREELMAFWVKHQNGRKYLDLFPDGGKGTKRATADLANYASNTATAMRCRAAGAIEGALIYERIADRIYSGLPEFARW